MAIKITTALVCGIFAFVIGPTHLLAPKPDTPPTQVQTPGLAQHSNTPSLRAAINPLLGEWDVVDSYQAGKKVPEELLAKLRVRFAERHLISSPALAEQPNITFTEISEAIGKGLNKRLEMVFVVDETGWTIPYQIDPTKVPQEIDLVESREGKEYRIKGIYKVDDNEAALIFGERYRPSDFGAAIEKRGMLFKLHRKGP